MKANGLKERVVTGVYTTKEKAFGRFLLVLSADRCPRAAYRQVALEFAF
jgi:hypothetical protein